MLRMAVAIFFVILVVACSNGSPKGQIASDHLELTEKSLGQSFVGADIGDRVHVLVKVRQLKDPYAECAKPVVKDPFGNPLTRLTMKEPLSEQLHTYEYAFLAASKGRYRVDLDNFECNVRITTVSADVTWTVYR